MYVDGYYDLNFGDDLFFECLFQRYPNVPFLCVADPAYKKKFSKYSNVEVLPRNVLFKVGNRLVSLFGASLFKMIQKKCLGTVLIGGSMFIEPGGPKTSPQGRGFYSVLGVNYGPAQTHSYEEAARDFFSQSYDVCFRDRTSYDVFSDLPNVRVAPDIAYSLDYSQYVRNPADRKYVFVSVIDLSADQRPSLAMYKDGYLTAIATEINSWMDRGMDVVVASFCEDEGDESVFDDLSGRIQASETQMVTNYRYQGDVEEVLSLMGGSSAVIGSRFHSIVIALAMGKPVLPISYSNKTDQMLEDIGLRSVEMAHLGARPINEQDYVAIDDKAIVDLRVKAREQFRGLDRHFGLDFGDERVDGGVHA